MVPILLIFLKSVRQNKAKWEQVPNPVHYHHILEEVFRVHELWLDHFLSGLFLVKQLVPFMHDHELR